jgi:uncharacterized protein (DUF2062 family)
MQTSRNKFFLRLLRVYERFLKIKGDPRKIARGFALGLFVGISPSMGVQTPIAILFAAILKWDKISAAIGVWITNPVTSPFIYSITYFVGMKVIGIRKTPGSIDELSLSTLAKILYKAPEIFWALIIGGVVVGLPVAVAGYYLSFSAIRRYQEDIKIKIAKQKERLAVKKKKITDKIKRRDPGDIK